MVKYTLNPKPGKSAKAYGSALRLSTKTSTLVCKKVSGMNLQKGKGLLAGLISQTRDINGRYYTNTAKELLNLIKSAETNAEFKGLDLDKLLIFASAHTGFTFWRPRRVKLSRRQRKITNLQVVLEQR